MDGNHLATPCHVCSPLRGSAWHGIHVAVFTFVASASHVVSFGEASLHAMLVSNGRMCVSNALRAVR